MTLLKIKIELCSFIIGSFLQEQCFPTNFGSRYPYKVKKYLAEPLDGFISMKIKVF